MGRIRALAGKIRAQDEERERARSVHGPSVRTLSAVRTLTRKFSSKVLSLRGTRSTITQVCVKELHVQPTTSQSFSVGGVVARELHVQPTTSQSFQSFSTATTCSVSGASLESVAATL